MYHGLFRDTACGNQIRTLLFTYIEINYRTLLTHVLPNSSAFSCEAKLCSSADNAPFYITDINDKEYWACKGGWGTKREGMREIKGEMWEGEGREKLNEMVKWR